MPLVNGQTLMMAIQAVDAQSSVLAAALERAAADEAAQLEERLLGFESAASQLRRAYQEALSAGFSLPPYDQLLSRLPNHVEAAAR